MGHRLETVDEQLVRELTEATPDQQRHVARLAADHARRATGGAASADAAACADLQRTVDQLDEVAWDAQDAADSGNGSHDAYVTAFRRARAASAEYFARCAEPESAALDGVYEAAAASEDPSELIADVRRYLRTSG